MPIRLMAAMFALMAGIAPAASSGAPARAEPMAPRMWVHGAQPTPQARTLFAILQRVEDFGLARADFTLMLAEIERAGAAPVDAARLDALIHAAALRLIDQLHRGRVDPRAAGYELRRRRTPLDSAAALAQLATAADVAGVLATVEPRSAQYRALKQALARYRMIPADVVSLPRPERAVIREGDTYAGSARLRRLLIALGDAPGSGDDPLPEDRYDAALAAAVEKFQARHGLTPDGVLGSRTFAALTVPIAHRIHQIELTLERWRWMPDIDPPAVIVNVPQFMLYALPDPEDAAAGARAARIPVIVGKSAQQTPIFDSAIESVVFRPYWNVPASILRHELLPLIARDFTYVARHDMEIVRGDGDDAEVLPMNAQAVAELRRGSARLRQRPGDNNALGLIKFVLPNPFSVYLHSTPEARLFARDQRAFSHGCIRVSDAAALAAYLLKHTPGNWDADAIEAASCGEKTFTVQLAKPVPVFILYGTVVIDADGAALFFDDIYGYDRRLDELLARSR